MSETQITPATTVNGEANADGQFDLFEVNRPRSASARTAAIRWREFDDAAEGMNALCMSDRMKRLAIEPVLLDELACVRDEWRWPSSLDTVDLLGATSPRIRERLISR